MQRVAFFALTFFLFVAFLSAQAPQQNRYYIFNGKTLEEKDYIPSVGSYTRWQVWLYQEGAHVSRYTAGLQYSRWGLMEGSSAENVMRQLRAAQEFEEAYLRFFGSGTWGRYTFLNPVGPIAVKGRAVDAESNTLDKLYQLRALQDEVNKLIRAVQPSLENNESEDQVSPVKGYFDQIRNVLRRVSRNSSQLSHDQPQLWFIGREIAQARTELAQAQENVWKITSVLPSVKLPTSNAWMSHAERAGSDGTIQVEVMETGYGVLVDQTWSDGDGSMTGTVIITTIPYKDIGKIDFQPPARNDDTWTVRVESATVPFVQTLNSPRRKTSRATFRAVHSATTENWCYFVFPRPAEARDAYAYFLYHKQLGR